MIIWRSNDQEWRRYVDYVFIALVVILLGVGVYGVLNWSDEGKVVETLPQLPAGLAPIQETTTTDRTIPPEFTLPGPSTTEVLVTTVAPTTVAPTVVTTVPRATTDTTVAPPVVTTAPPPPDTSGPSIGSLSTSPKKVYEDRCTPSVKFSVSISDPSGVTEAKMFGKAMSRRAGSNTWELTTSIGDVTSAAQGSISFSVPISAKDGKGNSRSKTASITVFDCP